MLFTEYVETLKRTLNNRVNEVGRDEQRRSMPISPVQRSTFLTSIFFVCGAGMDHRHCLVGQAPVESDWGGYGTWQSSLAMVRQLQESPSTRQHGGIRRYPSKLFRVGHVAASAQSFAIG